MVEHRHRLNTVMFRRTKADACRPDGSPLFARRWVHTESFMMSDAERGFYEELRCTCWTASPSPNGRATKGRALGFVMTIFQKIAASSFAAVRRTLRRRLIALTIQEGLFHDAKLDIDGRDAAFAEASELIRREFGLRDDRWATVEAERHPGRPEASAAQEDERGGADLASGEYSSETVTTDAEDAAITAVELALPEERQRIRRIAGEVPDADGNEG